MRLLVGILVGLVVLSDRSSYSHAGEVAAPPAPAVNGPAPPAAPDLPPAVPLAPTIVPPPLAVPPPLVAPRPLAPPLLATLDPDAVANAQALRNGGIMLFAVGLPVTILSQVLLGISIVQSFTIEGDGPSQAQADEHARPYRIAAIVTTISGNIMIASGLAMWGTGNAALRAKPRALTVGTLYVAPSAEGHGGVGGLVVHF